MPTWISDADFSSAPGVEQWRTLYWGAKTFFPTADFAAGARLVSVIAEQAAQLGHPPMVDLRENGVTVQVFTVGIGLSDVDLELARRISAAAAGEGFVSDPSRVSELEITIDAEDPDAVARFWGAAIGYVRVAPEALVDPTLMGPTVAVHRKGYVAPRNRIHLDVSLPHDVARGRVEAVLAAGGRMLGDRRAPAYWSMIDPEGNVVDIATWQGRDDG